LKGRKNIIVTGNRDYKVEFDETKVCHSLDEAIDFCKSENFEKAFIIGGGQIYKQAMIIADEMILSFMKFEAAGEVTFPEIKISEWKIESTEDREQFEIRRYVKKNGEAN
jgi:dihydrofolate reductase